MTITYLTSGWVGQRLFERSWIAVMEACFALTLFRDDVNATFLSKFGALLFFKALHWISLDRIELVCCFAVLSG